MEEEVWEAVVLAGGKGTRLQGVVSDRPKAMAEVAGRPFAEWLLLALRGQGVRRLTFCTGYMHEQVERHFGDGSRWNIEVCCSREESPLGTAGAIRRALQAHIRSDRFLVLNGDSYCRADVGRLAATHAARGAVVSLCTVAVEDCSRFGSVEVGDNGAVLAFREKCAAKRPGLINAGVYLMNRSIVETIPEGAAMSLETELFPRLIGRGLYAITEEGPFLDIGTPEAYAAASGFFNWAELDLSAGTSARTGG